MTDYWVVLSHTKYTEDSKIGGTVTIYVTIYVGYESQESLECHFIMVILQEIHKSCHAATLTCDHNDDFFFFPH